MAEIVEYPDGLESHGKKGSVVPRSTSRSQDDELGASISDDTGSAIDINEPPVMNVIECDAKGNLIKSVALDGAAQKRLRENSRVKPGVNGRPNLAAFYEAAKKDPNQPILEMVPTSTFKRALTYEEQVAAAAATEAQERTPVKELLQRNTEVRRQMEAVLTPQSENEIEVIACHPRTKAKFIGAFGSISVLYNLIHEHEQQLVMLQYSADGQFNEAPSGDQEVLVEIDHRRYKCFPGPQIPLLPGSKLLITIYFISEAPSDGEER